MRWLAAALAMAAVAGLAACSSLSLGPAAPVRPIDYIGDDLADALVALDLPALLEPIPGGTALTLDLTTPSSGERHVRAVLQQSDGADLAGTLPPPADGRSYYLFGFSPADQAAIREAQAFAKGLPPGAADLRILLSPAICADGPVKPDSIHVSVRVALPGAPPLAPIIADQPLSVVAGGAPVPACAGHSG